MTTLFQTAGTSCVVARGLAVLALLVVSGCAAQQPLDHSSQDPWEGFNRKVFSFNESVDAIVVKPVASAYRKVLPEPAREGVSNVFANLEDLPSGVNNFMQGDFSGGGDDLLRFAINSTVGVLGIFDVAAKMGMYRQPEDFGQTLGVWGVDSGPYVMLPLFGPSTVRGVPGKVVDFLLSPLGWLFNSDTATVLRVTNVVSERAGFIEQEEILRQMSPDFYAQMRDFYLNRREHLIRDGAGVVESVDYEDEDL